MGIIPSHGAVLGFMPRCDEDGIIPADQSTNCPITHSLLASFSGAVNGLYPNIKAGQKLLQGQSLLLLRVL